MSERRSPHQWCRDLDASILDWDGWRDGDRSWDEPIGREEFDRRLLLCTIDSRRYPTFYRQPVGEADR